MKKVYINRQWQGGADPVARDGAEEIAIRPMCALNLSYDHRIIDGAEAAKFLQKIKQYVQNPALML